MSVTAVEVMLWAIKAVLYGMVYPCAAAEPSVQQARVW